MSRRRKNAARLLLIAAGTALPHLWQVLRDYGLPALLAPAMSISELQAVPKCITLSDLLLFWLLCRFAACLCMSGASTRPGVPTMVPTKDGVFDFDAPKPKIPLGEITQKIEDPDFIRGTVNDVYAVAKANADAGKELPKMFFRVGDCVAIGNLRTVIWRAWDVCMKI